MAVDRIGVDEQEVKGVEMSKAEKARIKRQQRKLKKFGLKDEATMGKLELFFYNMEKKRRIKKKKRVSRSLAGDISLFLLLALFGCFYCVSATMTVKHSCHITDKFIVAILKANRLKKVLRCRAWGSVTYMRATLVNEVHRLPC